MHALVVFESMYGNTWQIAESVAEGLSTGLAAEVAEVGSAPRELGAEVALLVVGAPTHAFGLSRESTRMSAAQQAGRAIVSAGDGVREWLDGLQVERGLAAAAFDSHTDKRWVPGSAAAAAHRRLRELGCHMVTRPTSSYVAGTEGPDLPGELERARAWGEALARQLAPAGA